MPHLSLMGRTDRRVRIAVAERDYIVDEDGHAQQVGTVDVQLEEGLLRIVVTRVDEAVVGPVEVILH